MSAGRARRWVYHYDYLAGNPGRWTAYEVEGALHDDGSLTCRHPMFPDWEQAKYEPGTHFEAESIAVTAAALAFELGRIFRGEDLSTITPERLEESERDVVVRRLG